MQAINQIAVEVMFADRPARRVEVKVAEGDDPAAMAEMAFKEATYDCAAKVKGIWDKLFANEPGRDPFGYYCLPPDCVSKVEEK